MQNPNTPEFWNKSYESDRSYEDMKKKRTRSNLIIKEIGKHLKTNSRILDLGCGSGLISHEFRKEQIYYKGIDFSEVAIKKAKEHFQNFDFEIVDLNEYKIEEAYNIILVLDILEHIDNPDRLLKQAIRKGNIIIINSPFKDTVKAKMHIHEFDAEFFSKYLTEGLVSNVELRVYNEKASGGKEFLIIMKNENFNN